MQAVIDRIVQYPNRYQLTNVETQEVLGTFDFDEVTGTVQQVGTEINKALFDSIATDLAARVVSNGGELSGTIVTFSDISGEAANVASGDTSATLWGKVKNWFSRLKALAFKNKVAAGDFEAGAIKNADVAADAAIAQSKVSGLDEALDAKANNADLAAIAKSGDLADATQDATHRVVTDTEKATWNAKQNAITGAASTIASQNLTANRALVSNDSGKVAVSTVTATELGYLDGVTSNIQSQLNNSGKINSSGGFQGGTGASAERGGAIGYNANATYGGAIGRNASATYGGAIGRNASATSGGAVGAEANATYGGAVGLEASATTGGAVGQSASATNGFAGGYSALSTADGAVQLGTGANKTENTLQFRNYQIVDANGNIPASRLSANSPVRSVNGKTGAVTLAKGDVGLSNVDNVKQYSASNPPPYPVTSVNGQTGAVSLSATDVGAATVAQVNSAGMVPYNGHATTLSAQATGGIYEMPDDGYIRVSYQTTSTTNYLTIIQVNSEGTQIWGGLNVGHRDYGSGYCHAFLPVAAGDRVQVSFSGSININQIQFIKRKTI